MSTVCGKDAVKKVLLFLVGTLKMNIFSLRHVNVPIPCRRTINSIITGTPLLYFLVLLFFFFCSIVLIFLIPFLPFLPTP